MHIRRLTLKGAAALLLLGAAALLTLSGLSGAEARSGHRRATSVYGGAPAYWGAERPAAARRDALGRRVARLHAADAKVVQLDPHLRGSDGRLAEHLAAIPPSGTPQSADYYFLPIYEGSPPLIYWRGFWHRHHRLRSRR